MNLVLFTSAYPYIRGGERNFLDIEIQYLTSRFEKVFIIPERVEDDLYGETYGAEVEIGYAEYLHSHGLLSLFLKGILSRLTYQGIKEKKFPRFSINAYRRLLAFAGKAEITKKWIQKWLKQREIYNEDCMFYTYWFDQAAAGIGLIKQEFPDFKLVSRAHGYDVYEEQYYDPPFWPSRHTVLKRMDTIFSASYAGAEYLKKRYSEFSSLFKVSFLGVRDPGFVTQYSVDGVFRIVSCSRISPEKRIDYMIDGIAYAANLRPDQLFEWHHFGNGEDRELLQKKADKMFPQNARGYLLEYLDNATLMQFYRESSIDVFLNTSSTEGIPVAIMEAMSCGIPVIATNVGGNSEVVSDQSGLLLDANPQFTELASAFFYFLDQPTNALIKRTESRWKWQSQFNADLNFMTFVDDLISIMKQDKRETSKNKF